MEYGEIQEYFQRHLKEMIEDMRALVEMETPSDRNDLLYPASERIARMIKERTGISAETVKIEGSAPAVIARTASGGILLACHYDTVHPAGTLDEFPFSINQGIIRGPGIYDMKGGIIKSIWAANYITNVMKHEIPLSILVTPDEETGSIKSKPTLIGEAKNSGIVMVMEPNINGNIKKSRKGVADFRIQARGIAAHAGVEPEKGASAILELSHAITKTAGLQDTSRGTTVNVGVIRGGTASNVVPDFAEAIIDVRVWNMEEFERVRNGIKSIKPVDSRVELTISGGLNRPPLEPSAVSEKIFSEILEIAHGMGMDIRAVGVGGGSDGNIMAQVGVPVIDGMGMSGGNAHTRNEFADISGLPGEMEFLVRSLIFLDGYLKTI